MAKSSQKIKTRKKTEAVPTTPAERWRGWLVVILATAGLSICLHLYSLHLDLLMGEIKSGPLCGADGGLGCHSVASSPYSSLLGLPLASWGAIFYGAIMLLGFGGVIFWRDCGRVFLRWAFGLAVMAFAFDLYLGQVMLFKIQAACWLCAATYAINLLIILFLVKSVWREPEPRISLRAIFPGTRDTQGIDFYYRNVIKGLLMGGIVFIAVAGVAGSQFLSKSLTENDRDRLAKIFEDLSHQRPQVMDIKNRPVKGSDDANVLIVEFSDFLCPFCGQAARYLKLAQSGTHDRSRFVFRHFPLDKSCNRKITSNLHPGACLLAEGAACANEQGRFWEYHDVAFETKGTISRSVVLDIASNTGLDAVAFNACLDSGRGLKVVYEDIEAAFKAGVRSTPTLFINGRRLRGVPKPWMLTEIVGYAEKHFALPESSKSAQP